jgi:hypothetical protein
MSQDKALRLNNPAGLTKGPGEAAVIPIGAHTELSGGGILVFAKPTYGIRALAVELQKLEQAHGQGTLADLMRHWAAFKGADPGRYLDAVPKHLKGASETLDLRRYEDLRPAVEAVIRAEQGRMPYSEAQLVKGLLLAGVEPQGRPLDQSRTLRAGVTAMLLLLLAIGVELMRMEPNGTEALLRKIAPALVSPFLSLQSHLASLQWAFYAFALVALGLVIWARLDDRRKGLR